MNKGSIERHVMTIHDPKLTNKQKRNEKIHVVRKSTVTLPPHNISIVPLPSINYPDIMHTNILLEIKENPFFSIEQANITIIPALQKLDNRKLDKFMAILWNLVGHCISIKRNTAIGYMIESDYITKFQTNQQENIGEMCEVSQDKVPSMPEKTSFIFHHNFYPKPKVVLEDAVIQMKLEVSYRY